MKSQTFLLKSKLHNQHVRTTVFAGYTDQALACCGTLIMNTNEWQMLVALLSLGANFMPAKIVMEGNQEVLDAIQELNY